MSFRRLMSLVAMAFLWTGSQIPVYLFGGIPPYIYADIGGADRWIWFVLANLLSLAAVCPFVGSLSDLLGRRYVASLGALLLVLGQIIASTATTMNNFIGKVFVDSMSGMLIIDSWNGDIGCSSRYQRANGARCDLGTGTYEEKGQVRCDTGVHHYTILSERLVGTTDRIAFELEILRPFMWTMGSDRSRHDTTLLLPTSARQLPRSEQEASTAANRLHRWLSEHFGHDTIHGWTTMGRLSGQSPC